MLHLKQVSKRYPGGVALEQVSFSLSAKEMVFITGHSGAGKSTLLKVIALIERHTSGEITFFGEPLTNIGHNAIPNLRRKLGIIFQNPSLLLDRTVFNNVALPLVIIGTPYREITRKVRASLDKVALLDKEHVFPQDLSCGEQQRVGIARAIVNKPPLLLADEPTGNLDPMLSYEIMNVFCQLNQVGVSAIIVSHDVNLISHFPFRKLTLDQGQLLEH
jgi:cell division transport system ATP-binding protein